MLMLRGSGNWTTQRGIFVTKNERSSCVMWRFTGGEYLVKVDMLYLWRSVDVVSRNLLSIHQKILKLMFPLNNCIGRMAVHIPTAVLLSRLYFICLELHSDELRAAEEIFHIGEMKRFQFVQQFISLSRVIIQQKMLIEV